MDNITIKESLTNDLCARLSDDKCAKCMAERSMQRVCDGMMHLLREACLEAPLGNFNNQMYYFDETMYIPVDKYTFDDSVYQVLRRKGLPDGYYGKIANIARVCRTAIMSKILHPDDSIVTFDNCVYEIETGRKRHFSPKFVSVTKVDYRYDPSAKCPRWENFLYEVLPDEALRNLLQEFLGCIFIDKRKTKIGKMAILLGSGANGKSVVCDVIEDLVGKDNVSRFGIDELMSGSDLKKNIAYINGKRLNYSSEINARRFVEGIDKLKSLIFGERSMGRELFQGNEDFDNFPLLMANANQLPKLKEDEINAITNRLFIFPFEITIPENKRNPNLAQELKKELPGIFNWVMEGRKRFVDRGCIFNPPLTITEILNEYRSESSSVLEFMADMGYSNSMPFRDKLEWISTRQLHDEYKQWCKKWHKPLHEIKEMNLFSRILRGANYGKKEKSSANGFYIYKTKSTKI